jgi:ribonuclease G
MDACFVDVGMGQNAFLRFSDIGEFFQGYGPIQDDSEDIEKWKRQEKEKKRRNIPLVTGQEILVQITKEPIGTKGARVTSEISLAGRFMVLVPGYDHVGVSRKIENLREKRRLKKIAQKIRPEGFGIIVRTVATRKDLKVLKADMENLLRTWDKIEKKARKDKGYSLLHKDMGMVSQIIRDLFTADVNRVVVDSRKLYREIANYLKEVSPNLVPRVELYRGINPIFDEFNIEREVDKCLARRVWLKSGGYILFDQTEALVAIDVNSGKYVSRGNHDDSSLKINLEAADEIARQLRLRDLGGIIVIDYIDMLEEKNRKKLITDFRRKLKVDRAKTSTTGISEFGLIEMTRERVRPSLIFSFSEPCPSCEALGFVPSSPVVVTKLELAIRRVRTVRKERRFKLIANPDFIKYLTDGLWNRLRKIMLKYFVTIELVPDPNLFYSQFKLISKKTGDDITSLIKT